MTRVLPFVLLAAGAMAFSGPRVLDSSSSATLVGADGLALPQCNGQGTIKNTVCPPAIGGNRCGANYLSLDTASKIQYFPPTQWCNYYLDCPTNIYKYPDPGQNCDP